MNTATKQKELRDFQYFYRLEDSLLFDKLLISHYPHERKVRDELWKSMGSSFKKNKQGKKEILGIILCNLKEGLLNLQTVAVSKNKNDYYNGRYCKLHLNYFDMVAVLNKLKHTGWIHIAKGFNSHDNSSKSRMTRIWASKKLATILLADLSGKTKVSHRKQKEELIVLKNWNNKKHLSFEETDFTITCRKNIEEYHDFMASVKIFSHISITHPSILKTIHRAIPFLPSQFSVIPPTIDKYSVYVRELSRYLGNITPKIESLSLSGITTPVNAVIYVTSHLLRRIDLEEPISPRIKLVFNKKSFMRGGRLYSGKNGWQNLSQADRKNITFDGKTAVEADFSGMHINMLYAMEKSPAPEKPYSIIVEDGGEPIQKGDPMRDIVKRMTLISINTKNDAETVRVMKGMEENLIEEKKKKGWLENKDFQMLSLLNSYNSFWDGNDEFWWDLLARIKTAHAPIQQYFCSDAGGKLMNKDSQIIMDACLALVRQGIPCLPVHDSIIAPAENQYELCKAMDDAFYKHMEAHCSIEIK